MQTLDVVHLAVSDIDAQADFRLLIQSQRAKEIALDAVRFAIVLHDDVRNTNSRLCDLYLGIRQRQTALIQVVRFCFVDGNTATTVEDELVRVDDAPLDGRVELPWDSGEIIFVAVFFAVGPTFLFTLMSCMRDILELLLTSIYAHDSVSLGAFVTHKLDAEHTNSRIEFFYDRIRK